MLYPRLSTNEQGHLTISGLDACELASTYGTPLYVLDEPFAVPLGMPRDGASAHDYQISVGMSLRANPSPRGELGLLVERLRPAEPAAKCLEAYLHGRNYTINQGRDIPATTALRAVAKASVRL